MLNQQVFRNWRVATLAEIKAIANANIKTLCFCDQTETIYRYDPTSGATADDQFVLITGAGGTTRWIGTGGKYNLPVSGGLGIVLVFGASMGSGDVGKFFQPNGIANGGKFNPPPDEESQIACPITGTIETLAWVATTGNTITNAVLKVWKNGVVVATKTVSGTNGATTGIGISVTAGNLIAVEYDDDGDDDPFSKSVISLFVRGV